MRRKKIAHTREKKWSIKANPKSTLKENLFLSAELKSLICEYVLEILPLLFRLVCMGKFLFW